jgi:hypothetical protein
MVSHHQLFQKARADVILGIGLSKLANLLFAKQLHKVFNARNIEAIALSLHPGNIKTGVFRSCSIAE